MFSVDSKFFAMNPRYYTRK